MKLFGCCFAKPPAVLKPEVDDEPTPIPGASAVTTPELALRLEVMEKQVSGLSRAIKDLTGKCVTREDLASMAGVEESKLEETKLKTGGGWRFLGAAASGDGEEEEGMERVTLG